MKPANEVLYDSEASLRLVDSALEELRSGGDAVADDARLFLDHVLHQQGGLLSLSKTLLQAFAQTTALLSRIRESRTLLERASVERLQQMEDRLKEISSATEVAATDILNGLDRAVAMVGDLEALSGADESNRAELHNKLRDELYGVMVHLQFQDITTQQLGYASKVIREMEARLSEVVAIFAPYAQELATPAEGEPGHDPAHHVVYDPAATTAPAAERQALADEIFTMKRTA